VSPFAARPVNFGQGINVQNRDYARGAGVVRFTSDLTAVMYHNVPFPVLAWLAALLVSVYVSVGMPRYRVPGIMSGLLLINCWVQAFVGFHGDAAEPPRHMMMAGVLLRLSLVLLGLVALSLVADRATSRATRNSVGHHQIH
jgi:hypothetical protein